MSSGTAAAPVADLVERSVGIGYECLFLYSDRLRPFAEFDIERHQLKHLTTEFVPHAMPQGYVGDFLYVPTPG